MGSPDGSERAGKRPRTSSTSESDEDEDQFIAFHSALQAHVAAGGTVASAVESIFDPGEGPTGARMRALGLAAPVLSALRAAPELADDLQRVAFMCKAVYELAEDDIDAVRHSRERLNLGLTGLDDVAELIRRAANIVVLSGAGVSVSCGIPDFRSKGGLYETVLERFGLHDPQAIFDLEEFKMDPRLFFSFAKDVMPSKDLLPSPTHYFVAELEKRGKLLRNYSQNIDGLERRGGISEGRVILCHGSFLSATCMRKSCRVNVPGEDIAAEVAAGSVPLCRVCSEPGQPAQAQARKNNTGYRSDDCDDVEDESDGTGAESMGVLKPDIVFFGESLPKSVGENLEKDIAAADLVLVLGTSLQVAPVARIPQYFKAGIPRVLVNRELVDYDFDVELLGDCDVVVAHLRRALGWHTTAINEPGDAETSAAADEENAKPEAGSGASEDLITVVDDMFAVRFQPPRRFMFQGAVEGSEDISSSSESSLEDEIQTESRPVALGPSGLAPSEGVRVNGEELGIKSAVVVRHLGDEDGIASEGSA